MKKKLLAVIALIIVVGSLWVGLTRGNGPEAAKPKPSASEDPPITITAKGSIVPATRATLSFKGSGRVESVLVKEGDKVKRGQALARLDTVDLELQVMAAENALALNEAMLGQAKAGAGPDEIEAAEASYAGALARYSQTLSGATVAEVKAAEAALETARERLAQTEATIEAESVAGKAALESAQAKLSQLRSGPQTADLKAAELQLEQAKNALWAAQIDRDGVKGSFGASSYQGKAADARVASAETAVQVAEGSLLKLRNGPSAEEITIAEAAVNQAEAQLKASEATAESTLAAAQAGVESAEARLHLLKLGPSKADREIAASNVAGAKAALETKKNGASQAEIEVALARVEQAKTAVKQAQVAFSNGTLVAPFDGLIASVQIRQGELVSPGAAAVVLGDTGEFLVETSDLDESSATKIQVGQPVEVVVNAFDDKVLKGKVMAIADYATITPTGDANYGVTIAFDGQDSSLRWGMTAKVDFGVEK